MITTIEIAQILALQQKGKQAKKFSFDKAIISLGVGKKNKKGLK